MRAAIRSPGKAPGTCTARPSCSARPSPPGAIAAMSSSSWSPGFTRGTCHTCVPKDSRSGEHAEAVQDLEVAREGLADAGGVADLDLAGEAEGHRHAVVEVGVDRHAL